MSGNLFEDRNWLLPKNYLATENKNERATGVTSPRPPLKEEPKREEQAISPKVEKCGLGPYCPFCKSQKKEEENKQQQKISPNVPKPQAKRPDTLSLNMTKTKQQWEAEMERLNSKYNLDCFSDSELDSESDEGEQYHYEHGYKTLIQKVPFTARRTLIHDSIIKVYIQNFDNRMYKSNERKKTRFMSNQCLCLLPNELEKKFKPLTCQLISHLMNISDILSCSTN